MLLTDPYTIAAVEMYASRRGINCNEALRRLVRSSLGFDPIGGWVDGRSKAKRATMKALRERKVASQRKLHFPAEYQQMYDDLKTKVGASDARRLVIEHAKHVQARQ